MNFENERVFVERWSIDRLIPYARNARTHSNAQVAQIAASIAEFGFNNPVLVDADGGIIAGHGRVLAARKLSLAEVPVIILRHLNQNQKRAFALADNKIALNAGWDEEMLRLELQALADQDVALALTGWAGAQMGGAPPARGTLRVVVWGTAAMLLTMLVGRAVGTTV